MQCPSPSIVTGSFAGYSCWGWHLWALRAWRTPVRAVLGFQVSIEKSSVILIGLPLWVACSFSLAAFNILFLFQFRQMNWITHVDKMGRKLDKRRILVAILWTSEILRDVSELPRTQLNYLWTVLLAAIAESSLDDIMYVSLRFLRSRHEDEIR